MARTWPILGIGLAVLWLFVRGVELAVSALVGEFLIGLVVGLPIAFASRRFYSAETNLRHGFIALPYAILYLLAFLKELLVANVIVAYMVLSPSLPIKPAVVVFPLRVRTEAAITAIANSISLTPGTLTMEYDEAENVLIVHTIHSRDKADVTAPIRRWEEYALVIFNEEGNPGDPVPTVSYVTAKERPHSWNQHPEEADTEVNANGE